MNYNSYNAYLEYIMVLNANSEAGMHIDLVDS